MEKVDKYGNGGSPSQLIITDKYGKVKSIYQEKLILTTTGSSGPATLIGATLNIPQYSGGGSTTWGSITGTLSAQTDLQAALNAKFDDPTGTAADYLDGTGTPTPFPTFASADKMVTVGRNATGATLHKGTIVYISGSTGNRPNFVKARANIEATSAGTFGVIENDIPNNSDGNCVTIGTIDNLDTRSTATYPFTNDTLVDGDTIYLSPTTAGYVTRIKPSAPNHLVYIGKVVRTSPTNGTIVYRIQNGYELDEIHDVAISSLANNDILQYDLSTDLWKNKSISSAGIEPTIAAGTTSQYWRGDKTWQPFPTIPTVTPSALTKIDDTNVTLTLGGSPSTALLAGVSLTLGWTGRLDDSRISSAAIWNAKQNAVTLTTTGTSGPATLVGSTLNIPEYGGSSSVSPIDIQLFTSSGVWTKPAGAKAVEIHLVGAGGGGGSGRRGAILTARYGGGAGSSGCLNAVRLDASSLSATENIWIGVGGNGASGATVNDTNGNAGSAGSASFFGGSGTVASSKICTNNSVGGAGGTNIAASSSSSFPSYLFGMNVSSLGYASGTVGSGNFGGANDNFQVRALQSGNIGGGINTTDVRSNGRGINTTGPQSGQVINSRSGGSAAGAFGLAGFLITNNPNNFYIALGGTGAAPGDTLGTIVGGVGGAGGPGAGGGGGGASTNGANSGAGGRGGDGFCMVITYF